MRHYPPYFIKFSALSMSHLLTLLSISCLVFCLGCNVIEESNSPKIKNSNIAWQWEDGVEKPESVYFDKASGFLFVTQIGKGSPKDLDQDGWISKVSTDGKVIKNKWVTGLSAPKGMRSHNGVLWVSDIDRIVAIEIASAKIIKSIPIERSKFLNDVAVDQNGNVYVSDMFTNTIYLYSNNTVSVFDNGEHLEHPNGLLVRGRQLIVGCWGSKMQNDFSTKTKGRLLAIDLKTKQRFNITAKQTGNLDGVETDGGKGYFVSDWIAGKVFHVNQDGESKIVLEPGKGTADIAYLTEQELLIVPEMLNNKITAYRVK